MKYSESLVYICNGNTSNDVWKKSNSLQNFLSESAEFLEDVMFFKSGVKLKVHGPNLARSNYLCGPPDSRVSN